MIALEHVATKVSSHTLNGPQKDPLPQEGQVHSLASNKSFTKVLQIPSKLTLKSRDSFYYGCAKRRIFWFFSLPPSPGRLFQIATPSMCSVGYSAWQRYGAVTVAETEGTAEACATRTRAVLLGGSHLLAKLFPLTQEILYSALRVAVLAL